MIQFSAQYGEPECANYFFPLQRKLNDLFKNFRLDDCFFSLKKISIIFRVSGKVRDFGWNGPEKFKYLRKKYEFTIDLTIPESNWRGKAVDELNIILKSGLIACCDIFIEKAVYFKELRDRELFIERFYSIISDFEKIPD